MSPGESSTWVTAYVGLCLRMTFRFMPKLTDCLDFIKIKFYLENSSKNDWGWGYNEKTRSDADSTALSILLLYELGAKIDERSWERLISFRQSDGGFATFDTRWQGDNWGISHSDVTPIVLKCLQLKRNKYKNLIQDGIKYIITNQLPSGLWPSYWWNTNYYSTKINVQFLEQNRVDYEKKRLLENLFRSDFEGCPFNMSQILEILVYLKVHNPLRDKITEKLCKVQDRNGSWKAKPMLRETIPEIELPWLSDSNVGHTVSDTNNIFTTASTIRALLLTHVSHPKTRF